MCLECLSDGWRVSVGVGVGVVFLATWCVFVYLDSLQVDCVHHSALKKGHCCIVTLQQSL